MNHALHIHAGRDSDGHWMVGIVCDEGMTPAEIAQAARLVTDAMRDVETDATAAQAERN